MLRFKRLAFTVVAILALLMSAVPLSRVQAADSECDDLTAINRDAALYDPCTVCAADGTGSQDVSKGSDTPKWVTQLTPPYNLEDFAVEALRALAPKMHVTEADTVTQEHVLFFVAYAQREGGNLTNNSLYNPWNTGYSGPDLKPVKHDTGGAQAYGSFNDGVEAYARVWSGTAGSQGYQSRMGTVFSNKTSSAEDLARALVYYKQYPGNKIWAAASDEPNAASYLQSEIISIQSTRTHYNSIASLQVGPPGNSARKNLHTSRPLRYKFAGDNTTNAGNSGGVVSTSPAESCTTGAEAASIVSGDIAKTAINLSWADCTPQTSCKHGLQAKQEYKDALNKFDNGGAFGGADCGSFVATVIRASGADPSFPTANTNAQEPYMKQRPQKYQQIQNVGNTSNLQPGDIFIIGNSGASGHTYIYIGPQPNGKNSAGASMKEQMPHQHVAYFNNDYGKFDIFRIIK